MSENLDLVRSIYADWERGDFSRADWADRDIEFVLADGVSPGTWHGVAEMSEAWSTVLSAWQDFRAEIETCRDLVDGRVLVLTDNNTGRGKTSGLDVGRVRTKGANVFHIGNGKVTRLVAYWSRERALADLGLEE